MKVNDMKAFEINEYLTIVAHNAEEAIRFYVEETEDGPEGITATEINAEQEYMFFPIEKIPKRKVMELMLQGAAFKIWDGDLCILITKAEAIQYRNEKKPYILCVDL